MHNVGKQKGDENLTESYAVLDVVAHVRRQAPVPRSKWRPMSICPPHPTPRVVLATSRLNLGRLCHYSARRPQRNASTTESRACCVSRRLSKRVVECRARASSCVAGVAGVAGHGPQDADRKIGPDGRQQCIYEGVALRPAHRQDLIRVAAETFIRLQSDIKERGHTRTVPGRRSANAAALLAKATSDTTA